MIRGLKPAPVFPIHTFMSIEEPNCPMTDSPHFRESSNRLRFELLGGHFYERPFPRKIDGLALRIINRNLKSFGYSFHHDG
jgi:hypothetical protein